MADRQLNLEGKVAFITGSTNGIGRAIALRLARMGADIIIHGRRKSDRATDVIRSIQDIGCEATSCYGDFSDGGQVASVADAAWNWKERLDILINNAGGDVLTGEWAHRAFEEKLDYLWATDVRATLMLSRKLGYQMRDSRSTADFPGVVVNVGWDQAWQGMEGDAGELFSTTKGAIIAMTKSLAQSLAPQVRVNAVAPGWIQTQWGAQASAQWQQRAREQSLMNRWGQPEDVAEAVGFLCSPAAGFVSGHILPVNGGFRFYSKESN